MKRTSMMATVAAALTLLLAAACGGVSGISIDGSSTVFPVTEAVAEEFQRVHRGVQVTVGVSGTGGGFKKFCAGETDISDASRPIKDEEAALCAEAGISYVELGVAIDALAVVVNPQNDWVPDGCITTDQLQAMWDEGSTVRTWRDVDPAWPATEIKFYAPGHDSGTFDYFTEVINGSSQQSRTEGVQFSEDDNVLVQGVAGDRGGIGYFGVAYYNENTSRLKALAIDGGDGCVEPNIAAIEADEYKPLGRPIFIYPKTSAMERPEVRAFLEFYMDKVSDLVLDVGYYPLPDATLAQYRTALEEALPG